MLLLTLLVCPAVGQAVIVHMKALKVLAGSTADCKLGNQETFFFLCQVQSKVNASHQSYTGSALIDRDTFSYTRGRFDRIY